MESVLSLASSYTALYLLQSGHWNVHLVLQNSLDINVSRSSKKWLSLNKNRKQFKWSNKRIRIYVRFMRQIFSLVIYT